MKNKFRALLIDDNNDVLKYVKLRLEKEITVDALSIKIEIETLHVVSEELPGGQGYQISERTIFNLGDLCSEPFDYIFSDFSYVGDSNKNEALRTRLLKEQCGVTKDDIKDFVLHIKDIKKKFDKMYESNKFDQENFIGNHIKTNFINHLGGILVYTNSPKPFDNYFEAEMPIRRDEIRRVFKNAKIEDFFLMHREFSITPQIDEVFRNVGDIKGAYYSSLLSKKIEALMEMAALKYMVTSQSKLRFANTKKAFRYLTALGLGLGALVALFGEVIYHSLYDTIVHTTQSPFQIKEFLIKLFILVSLLVLSWIIFPRYGVLIAKKTETKVDDLLEH